MCISSQHSADLEEQRNATDQSTVNLNHILRENDIEAEESTFACQSQSESLKELQMLTTNFCIVKSSKEKTLLLLLNKILQSSFLRNETGESDYNENLNMREDLEEKYSNLVLAESRKSQ